MMTNMKCHDMHEPHKRAFYKLAIYRHRVDRFLQSLLLKLDQPDIMKSLVSIYLSWADELTKKNNMNEAIKRYGEALKLKPDLLPVYK
jgi:hypothetical protein